MMATTSSSSAAVAAQLPEDVLGEIWKRLPVRTLLQLKCVCKSWCRLLTDPLLVNKLHQNPIPPTRIILPRYFTALLSLPLHSNPDFKLNPQELNLPLIAGHTYYVKGHCNGLLCLIINDGDGDGTIVLWNPSIRRSKTLPTPSNFRKTREVLGIGYDPSINDYKIVRVPSSYCKLKVNDYRPQVQVLALNSNTWRKLPDSETPPYFVEHYQQSLALNGAVYWLTLDDFSTLILRFDLSKERFACVPPPPPPPDDSGRNRNISWLGVLNDALCVFHSHRHTHFDIWATRDDLTWKKLITVSKMVGPEISLRSMDYVPLCFMESGALLIRLRGQGLVAYDPEKQRYRRFAGFDLVKDACWLQETVYTDSLVFPHAPNRFTLPC